jgi:hypothetical protein
LAAKARKDVRRLYYIIADIRPKQNYQADTASG